MADGILKTLPLHELHRELGARMAGFAGYDMPIQYPMGLRAEHLHTRAHAGLFDVSHMGQLRVTGPQLHSALESALPVDFADCWRRKKIKYLKDIPVYLLSVDDLIQLKEYANREQDRADIVNLKRFYKK